MRPAPESADEQDGPWTLAELEPTNIVVLLPDAAAPSLEEVLDALRASARRIEMVGELECDDCALTWTAAVQVEGAVAPLVIWVQEAEPPPPEVPVPEGAACRWAIGIETLLDPAAPLEGFALLMRVVCDAWPHAASVLDVNATTWYAPEAVRQVFCDGTVEPPAAALWAVHVVRGAAHDGRELAWVHTHGLWRCGLPELEMLEIPVASADAAAEVVHDVAEMLVDGQVPAPREPMEIGPGHFVALVPWTEVVPFVPDGAPGGATDRTDGDELHLGERAVLCEPERRGAFRQVWCAPTTLVESLMRSGACIYRTPRFTRRQSQLAQASWDQFATAFAVLGRRRRDCGDHACAGVSFGVKVGFPCDGEEEELEHLWFEVHAFDGPEVEVELVNDPYRVRTLRRGERTRIHRDRLSDWIVATPDGCFGPSQVEQLWAVLDGMRPEA